MKEIEFRGKDTDYGTWRYGDLRYYESGEVGISSWGRSYGYGLITSRVDPATVGLYTGRKDRHGTKLYKDDIVEEDEGILVVVWDAELAMFKFAVPIEDGYGEAFAFDEINPITVVVIGNLHDNPTILNPRRMMESLPEWI